MKKIIIGIFIAICGLGLVMTFQIRKKEAERKMISLLFDPVKKVKDKEMYSYYEIINKIKFVINNINDFHSNEHKEFMDKFRIISEKRMNIFYIHTYDDFDTYFPNEKDDLKLKNKKIMKIVFCDEFFTEKIVLFFDLYEENLLKTNNFINEKDENFIFFNSLNKRLKAINRVFDDFSHEKENDDPLYFITLYSKIEEKKAPDFLVIYNKKIDVNKYRFLLKEDVKVFEKSEDKIFARNKEAIKMVWITGLMVKTYIFDFDNGRLLMDK